MKIVNREWYQEQHVSCLIYTKDKLINKVKRGVGADG